MITRTNIRKREEVGVHPRVTTKQKIRRTNILKRKEVGVHPGVTTKQQIRYITS